MDLGLNAHGRFHRYSHMRPATFSRYGLYRRNDEASAPQEMKLVLGLSCSGNQREGQCTEKGRKSSCTEAQEAGCLPLTRMLVGVCSFVIEWESCMKVKHD